MKNSFLLGLVFTTSLGSAAVADTTIGVGIGSLYSGLGLNFGRTTESSLTYGSVGCMGGSTSTSRSTSGDDGSRDSDYETNCGLGLGYISTALMPGTNHGLGLSLGYSYNTDEVSGGSELHVMPGYHYFFNGVGQRGLNLGFGVRVTRSDEQSNATGLIFNLGYQF